MNNQVKDVNALQQLIGLGLDAEALVKSKLGNYLLDRARDEAMIAMDELKSIAPTETDRIRELQNIIYRAESFEGWLSEAIQVGINSQEQLELIGAQE